MSFLAKRNWQNVEFLEPLAAWSAEDVACFQCHEVRVKVVLSHKPIPGAVRRRSHEFESSLHLHWDDVWLDLADVKEHLVVFMHCVLMRTSKIICLPYCLVLLQSVSHSLHHIVDPDRLDLRVLSLNDVQRPVKSLHHVRELSVDLAHVSKVVVHHARSEDGYIRASFLHFLLSNPLCPQELRRAVGVSSCCGNIDETFDSRVGCNLLGNVPWDKYV